ncbi:hypothetical protein CspeluHIS016_0303940 [Cutaneotrichosporon spelunceum]|uniref:Dolichyl-diphosphooligosaccharide--protein glycosyltransferase subunit 4 n=1 Tax=Cutaneotrichosporon spelunceum TaxID=1672016 RepID=A0AAD3TU26_9TREE|nr:hypothetical protein CspeluHIS016_0303940 [Cutaneotrichosporon spelunceum]
MTSDVSRVSRMLSSTPSCRTQRYRCRSPQGALSKRHRFLTLPIPDIMISDGTLTNLSNGLGVAAMVLILAYHFVSVNGQRIKERQ